MEFNKLVKDRVCKECFDDAPEWVKDCIMDRPEKKIGDVYND
jgi:hypothetical protein